METTSIAVKALEKTAITSNRLRIVAGSRKGTRPISVSRFLQREKDGTLYKKTGDLFKNASETHPSPENSMNLEKVAAAAFLEELRYISAELGPEVGEKLASTFYGHLLGDITEDQLAGFMKEAGVLDALKNFARGGTQNGIPMMSLGQQLASSNPFQGMGSGLAAGARAAGGAASNVAQKIRSAVAGGTNAQGIPMKGLSQMAGESNPLQGMGSSLAQGGRELGSMAANKLRGAANAVGRAVNGGANAQGVPMMGLRQQLAASNPFHGMGDNMVEGAQSFRRPMPGMALA